jgi:hypothetical protein
MTSLKFLTFLAALTIYQVCHCQIPDSVWTLADSLTLRLQPSAFPQLPKGIVNYLEKEGYTIPQCCQDSNPHNVISGFFAKAAQRDWAVLASRNRVSAILVFWNGSDRQPAVVDPVRDRSFLQQIREDSVGFSRTISVAHKDFIVRHLDSYEGTKPLPIDHEGIEDTFVDKASGVHYYDKGKWLQLPGLD